MDGLSEGELSQPFKTSWGWHILRVLARRDHDNTEEVRRAQARNAIFQRKANEEPRRLAGRAPGQRVRPNPTRRVNGAPAPRVWDSTILHDPEIIERSVAAISPRRGESIRRDRPGTRMRSPFPSLLAPDSLDVIEVDHELARRLPRLTGLRVHVGDALAWPLEGLANEGSRLRRRRQPALLPLHPAPLSVVRAGRLHRGHALHAAARGGAPHDGGARHLRLRASRPHGAVPRGGDGAVRSAAGGVSGRRPGCGPRSFASASFARVRSATWTVSAGW